MRQNEKPKELVEMALLEVRNLKKHFLIKKGIIAGSISPHLVPIITPSNGVNPIEVSMLFPFITAAILEPFPMWQVIIFNLSYSLPIISAAFFET